MAITFYVLLASEFFLRFKNKRPVRTKAYLAVDPSRSQINRKMKWMVIGLGFSTICIFIRYALPPSSPLNRHLYALRTVYRTIELINGFTGRIIQTQIYFSKCLQIYHDRIVTTNDADVLDGAMIVLATYTLNFLHPGYLLADVIAAERKAKSDGKNNLPLSHYESQEDSERLIGSKHNSMMSWKS